jgi:hypothetical protein
MNRLRVLQGRAGLDSDPRPRDPRWNREWTILQNGDTNFSTETARVDVVNPGSTDGSRIFIGGSRTFSDPFAVAERLSQLPYDTVVLTSPTCGASAAVRETVFDQGLQMEVWTARIDRFPTREAAYFARDEEMIRSADCVIAFWDGSSSGTAHELDYARQIGKPVEVLSAFEAPTSSARVQRNRRHLFRLPIDRGTPSRRPPDRHPGGDAA